MCTPMPHFTACSSHLASCSLSFSGSVYHRDSTKHPSALLVIPPAFFLWCLPFQGGNQQPFALHRIFALISANFSIYSDFISVPRSNSFLLMVSLHCSSSIILPQSDANAKHPNKIHRQWLLNSSALKGSLPVLSSLHKKRQHKLPTQKGVSPSFFQTVLFYFRAL